MCTAALSKIGGTDSGMHNKTQVQNVLELCVDRSIRDQALTMTYSQATSHLVAKGRGIAYIGCGLGTRVSISRPCVEDPRVAILRSILICRAMLTSYNKSSVRITMPRHVSKYRSDSSRSTTQSDRRYCSNDFSTLPAPQNAALRCVGISWKGKMAISIS
jgi:hypothetical protein